MAPSARVQNHDRGPSVSVLVGGSLACLLFFAGLWVAVANQAAVVIDLDTTLSTALHDLAMSQPWLVTTALALEEAGSLWVSTSMTVLAVALIIGFGLAGRLGPSWRYVVGFLCASAIGGALIAVVVKEAVGRTRPPWNGQWSFESDPSFPSGHAQAGISVWCALAVAAIVLLPGPIRWVVGGVLLVLGPTIGFSRLILGVHWPTDVLAGWTLGGAWLLACAAVALSLARRSAAAHEPESHPLVTDQDHRGYNNGGHDGESRP